MIALNCLDCDPVCGLWKTQLIKGPLVSLLAE